MNTFPIQVRVVRPEYHPMAVEMAKAMGQELPPIRPELKIQAAGTTVNREYGVSDAIVLTEDVATLLDMGERTAPSLVEGSDEKYMEAALVTDGLHTFEITLGDTRLSVAEGNAFWLRHFGAVMTLQKMYKERDESALLNAWEEDDDYTREQLAAFREQYYSERNKGS